MLLGSPRPINYLPGAVLGRTFAGGTDNYSHALDLSAESKVTVSFWAKYALTSDINAFFECRTSGGHGLIFYRNSTNNLFNLDVIGNAEKEYGIAFPSIGTYHHFLLVASTSAVGTLRVDGSLQTLGRNDGAGSGGNFTNATLYIAHDQNTHGGGDSKMTCGLFGIWDHNVSLTDAEIARLVNGETPLAVHPTNLLLHVESF